MIRHIIKLEGEAAQGARVSIHVLRALSDALVDAAQRSLRLRVDGRSNLQGKADWVGRATDFQLVGLGEGSTVLEFEAPTLGEAAPEIFEQLPLWDYSPRKEQSAVSLVEDMLRDATDGNAESDLLDRNVLDSIKDFGRVLDYGFKSFVLNGGDSSGRPVTVTRSGIEAAQRLREEAPSSQPVIVTGWLDQLTGSTRAFKLLLAQGQSIRGVLPAGDPSAYGDLFTKRVVVDGEARFRPSGKVSLIIAANLRTAEDADAVWEHIPRPRARSLSELRPRVSLPPGASDMDRVFGQWPGDESTEELLAALQAIG